MSETQVETPAKTYPPIKLSVEVPSKYVAIFTELLNLHPYTTSSIEQHLMDVIYEEDVLENFLLDTLLELVKFIAEKKKRAKEE